MAAEYVYNSNGPTSSTAFLQQRDGDDLDLIRTVTDVIFVVVADGKVWCRGINANANTLRALDPDDISSTVFTTVNNDGPIYASNDRLYTIKQTGVAANDQLSKIDTSDGSKEWTTTGGMGVSPDHVVDDSQHVYVCKTGTSPFSVSKLRISDGVILSTLTLTGFGRPTGAAIIGSELYVSASIPSQIARIDTATMTLTTTYSFSGGIGPNKIVTDGTDLFFGLSNTLRRFSPASGTIVESLSTTNSHNILWYGNNNLYTVGTGPSANVGQLSYMTTSPLAEVDTAIPAGRQAYGVAAWSQATPAGWVVGSVGW